MTWKQVFTSSVGKKLVMGFTGIFLVLFLIVHVGLNACIWAAAYDPADQGQMFNKAAHFMGSNVLPRVLEIGLFAGFFLHIFQGYLLTLENRKKRSIGYAVSYADGSKWYSRSMAILGTLLLMFLVMHIYHFWTPSRLGGIGTVQPLEEVFYNGVKHHNLYAEMRDVFVGNTLIVALYVLACGSLAYHLLHGFQSAFKTIGIHNKKISGLINSVGVGFSIIVPLLFALMPLSFYFGWIN
jgi:succinate dehydrogenase / fumarate reductase cytochrome b subunit